MTGETDRNQTIREFTPVIKSLARRMAWRLPGGLEPGDLESAGVIGLMDAMDKFDPSKGARLKTYAEIRIQGAMLDEIRANDWVPRSVRRIRGRIEKTRRLLQARHGVPPTQEDLAAELRMSLAELQEHLSAARGAVTLSIEDLVSRDKNGLETPRSLMDNEQPDPLSAVVAGNLREVLGKAIERLPRQERLVMTLYYYEELTMREVASVLGVTESRVCQIHSKAVRELKTQLQSAA